MFLWVILAGLTALSLSFVLYPLSRREDGDGQGRAAFDTSVYKAQLTEVDEDLARGLINAEDAESARVEISRRLLTSADQMSPGGSDVKRESRGSTFAILASIIFVPVFSLVLYLGYGSPGLPDLPRSARMQEPAEKQRVDELVTRVEERLREHPDDGHGWEVIAPVYLKHGRFDDAAAAFGKAIALLGETKERLFGLGEAVRLQNDGIVSERAKELFERSVKLDPNYVPSLYRLAVSMEQDGRFDDAVEAWKQIIEKLPAGVAWQQDAKRRLVVAEAKAAGKPVPQFGSDSDEQASPVSQPGPTKEQIEAVQRMKPEERMAMINQMVTGLAERLKQDGSDVNGWLRLVRAYSVLGRRDDAVKALSDARSSLKGQSDALAQLDAIARQLGLDG